MAYKERSNLIPWFGADPKEIDIAVSELLRQRIQTWHTLDTRLTPSCPELNQHTMAGLWKLMLALQDRREPQAGSSFSHPRLRVKND